MHLRRSDGVKLEHLVHRAIATVDFRHHASAPDSSSTPRSVKIGGSCVIGFPQLWQPRAKIVEIEARWNRREVFVLVVREEPGDDICRSSVRRPESGTRPSQVDEWLRTTRGHVLGDVRPRDLLLGRRHIDDATILVVAAKRSAGRQKVAPQGAVERHQPLRQKAALRVAFKESRSTSSAFVDRFKRTQIGPAPASVARFANPVADSAIDHSRVTR
jgi:hypothetical protein